MQHLFEAISLLWLNCGSFNASNKHSIKKKISTKVSAKLL